MEATQPEPGQRPELSLAQQPLSLWRTLQVFTHDVCVGELRDERGVWSFTYDVKWVSGADSYAITPEIPLQKEPIVDSPTIRPVQRYFENLLPVERTRTLLATDARVDAADTFALLACFGAESAGGPLGDYPRYLWFGSARKKPAAMLSLVSGQRGRETP